MVLTQKTFGQKSDLVAQNNWITYLSKSVTFAPQLRQFLRRIRRRRIILGRSTFFPIEQVRHERLQLGQAPRVLLTVASMFRIVGARILSTDATLDQFRQFGFEPDPTLHSQNGFRTLRRRLFELPLPAMIDRGTVRSVRCDQHLQDIVE